MKDFVQKEVDKQLNDIKDNKEKNYKNIVETYFQQPATKSKKFARVVWKVLAPIMATVILIVGTIAIVNNLKSQTEHVYLADNEIAVDATIEELNKESKSFILSFDTLDVVENKRVYDSVTEDTLMFRLILEKNSVAINVVYVVNANYKYDFDMSLVNKDATFQNINIKYISTFSSYNLTVYAYLEKDGQELVITYTQRAMNDSEEAFWTFMNEFIKVK